MYKITLHVLYEVYVLNMYSNTPITDNLHV